MKTRLLFFTQIILATSLFGDWSTPVVLSDTSYTGELSQVAMDPRGNAIVVWHQYTASGTIVAAKQKAWTDPSWSSAQDLSNGENNCQPPDVAIDASGNMVVMWSVGPGDTGHLRASQKAWADSSWSTPLDPGTAGCDAPKVAMNESGQIVAGWRKYGMKYSVQASTKAWADSSWALAQTLSAANQFSLNPHPAIDANGNVLTEWWGEKNADNHYWILSSQKTWSDPSWSSPPLAVSSDPTPYSVYNGWIAMDPSGRAVAVWAQYNGTTYVVRASTKAWSEPSWSTPVDIYVGGTDVRVAIDAHGNAIASWIEQQSLLKSATKAWNDSSWSTPLLVSSDSNLYIPSEYAIAMDPKGNAVAVWAQSNDTTRIIKAATKAWSDPSWSTPTILSADQFGEIPEVAMDARGNIVATWMGRIAGIPVIEAAIGTGFFAPDPASSLTGRQFSNHYFKQTDIVNELSWQASPSEGVVSYAIYRNTSPLAVVDAQGPLLYRDHNQRGNVSVVYDVYAVDDVGMKSTPISITLP